MDEEFEVMLTDEIIEQADWSQIDWNIPLVSVPSEVPAKIIHAWAAEISCIRKVYVFGSRIFQRNTHESDLDVAVMLDVADDAADADFMSNSKLWSKQLHDLTGYVIDIQFAHPVLGPNVWSYLLDGAGLVYPKEEKGTDSFLSYERFV
ncbi:MAG: hypothetical protein RIG26_09685 [Thalassospira sp.]|uniref:hypothetical protein n=1 Tax=Thalassospira sp. TaxID=1912094 RepID=UPI0032EFE142